MSRGSRAAGTAPSAPAAPRPAHVAAHSSPWGRWGLRTTAIAYLGLGVALPLAAVIERGLSAGLREFWRSVTAPAAAEALQLTLLLAAIMTAVNLVFGVATAYVLARYEFPGRGFFNGLVDLPFSVPTLVTGLMLVVLYGPAGFLGRWLEGHGMRIIFAQPGILLALLFVCYPFVVRTVQPVLLGAERSEEEAAWTLGASRWRTFWRITLPEILPAVMTGALLCFARALGEFGSIVIVAGNIPGKTLTAPVYIYGEIESQNPRGASAVSIVLLTISFAMLLLVDAYGRRAKAAAASG
ncbi:MAG: sulfate ABC transporter permease subunit CysT [Thermoanaerobaculia bacterium]